MQNKIGIAAAWVLALFDSFRLTAFLKFCTCNRRQATESIGLLAHSSPLYQSLKECSAKPQEHLSVLNTLSVWTTTNGLNIQRDMPIQARPRHPFDCGSGLFTMWSKCKAVNGSRLKDLVDTLAEPTLEIPPRTADLAAIWCLNMIKCVEFSHSAIATANGLLEFVLRACGQ